MLAEAIATVENGPPQHRSATLAEYASNSIPEIAQWATRDIFRHSVKDAAGILLDSGVPRKELPVASKLALDEILVQHNGKSWACSDRRYALLSEVVQQPLDKIERIMVAQRLHVMAQHEPASRQRLFGVIKKSIQNEKVSASLRHMCLRILGYYGSEVEQSEVVDLLIEQLANADSTTALVAASVLKNQKNLTEQQKIQLRELTKSMKHKDLRR